MQPASIFSYFRDTLSQFVISTQLQIAFFHVFIQVLQYCNSMASETLELCKSSAVLQCWLWQMDRMAGFSRWTSTIANNRWYGPYSMTFLCRNTCQDLGNTWWANVHVMIVIYLKMPFTTGFTHTQIFSSCIDLYRMFYFHRLRKGRFEKFIARLLDGLLIKLKPFQKA